MTDLRQMRDAARADGVARAKRRLRDVRLSQRVDGGLVVLTLGGLVLSSLAGYALASWLVGGSLLDPHLPAEVDDPRILTDYRDAASPMVDAVASGRSVVIGRKDGALSSFDTLTRRFSESTIPRADAGLSGPLSLLSADCRPVAGQPWQSCQGGEVLHALTRSGGLARTEGGRWSVVVGDAAFVGTDGAAVEQADVVDWVASGDGGTILVDAGAKGLGLFREAGGTWTVLPAVAGEDHRLAAWQDRFFVGTSTGLFRVDPASGAVPIEGASGEVLSLDTPADGSGGPVALIRTRCVGNGEMGCLSLLQAERGGGVRALLKETARFPALSDAGLVHAVAQAGRLVTLGTAGLHVYDPATRSWAALDARPPTAHFAEGEGRRLHVGFPDRFVTVEGARVLSEKPLDDPLTQVLATAPGVVWGLDRAGRILRLDGAGSTVVEKDPGLPDNAVFRAAALWGNRFVALGPDGLFLHDMVARRYAFVPATSYPPLPADDVAIVAEASRLWLVDRGFGRVFVLTIEGDLPAPIAVVTEVGALGPGVRGARAATNGLDVVMRDGTIKQVRLAPAVSGGAAPRAQVSDLVGNPLIGSLMPKTMAGLGDKLLFADDRQMWGYDRPARSWDGPWPGPEGAVIRDMAFASGEIVLLDMDGMVHANAATAVWTPVSGGPVRAALSASDLTDAMTDGGTIYLAGNGLVQAYMPDRRTFGAVWPGAGRTARLLSVAGGVPLWTTEAGIFSGNKRLFVGHSLQGAWLGATGPVALAEDAGGQYIFDGLNCLFRGARPPEGAMTGVVALPEGRLMVATDQGAGLYEPDRHRWLRLDGLRADAGDHLLVMAGQLVHVGRDTIQSLPLEAIPVSSSCDTGAITLDWAVSLSGVRPTLVADRAEVILLDSDGTLGRWTAGRIELMAPGAGTGPRTGDLRKAYATPSGFDLLTEVALWSYDVTERQWQTRGFTGLPGRVAQIDRVASGNDFVVSAWDVEGGLWVGRATVDGPGVDIRFTEVTRPVLPVLPFDPARLRDLAALPQTIFALSDRQLALFDRDSQTARSVIDLPEAEAGWSLWERAGTVVLVDGSVERPVAMHVLTYGSLRGRRNLSDVAWRYSPGTDRAFAFSWGDTEPTLWRIDAGQGLLRCGKGGAGEAPSCEVAARPPLELTDKDLLTATRGPDAEQWVLQVGDGMVVVDSALREVERYEEPRLQADGQVFGQDGSPFIWEGRGRGLWRLTEEGPVQLLPRVAHLTRINGALLAFGTEGPQFVTKDGAKPVAPVKGLIDGPARLAHVGAAGSTFLSTAGEAVTGDGTTRSDPLIRFPDTLRTLIAVRGGAGGRMDWLGLDGDGGLSRFGMTTCEYPAGLAPPGPEFIGAMPPAIPPAPVPSSFIGPMPKVDLPPPLVRPCAETVPLRVTLQEGEVLVDARPENDRVIVATDRRWIVVSRSTGQLISDSAAPPVDLRVAQGRQDMVNQIRQVDGRSYLNPPSLDGTDLRGLTIGQLVRLEFPMPIPAFALDWVNWNRTNGTVDFKRSNGSSPLSLSPTEAMPEGRFLPLTPAKGLGLPGGGVAWLTADGLWRGDSSGGMTFVGADGIDSPVAMMEGVFLGSGRQVSGFDGSAGPQPGPFAMSRDLLTLTTDAVAQRVEATIEIGGRRVPDLASTGFLHDTRIWAGDLAGEAVYLTPVGIVPARGFSLGLAVPESATRLANEAGALLVSVAGGWQALQGSGWVPTDAPFQNGILARENGRTWERVDGTIRVRADRPQEDWLVARQGLAFDIDRLLSFAATPGVAVAVTQAGTQAAASPGGLAGVRAPDAAAPGGDLNAMRNAEATWMVHADAPGGRVVWDIGQRRWRNPASGEEGWIGRVAARGKEIEIRFDMGSPRLSIAVNRVGVGPDRVSFDWNAGSAMPFDEVVALVAEAQSDVLLLGTRLGLRQVRAGGAHANMGLFLPASGGSVVVQAGRSAVQPGTVQVQFDGGGCLEAAAPGQPLSDCGSVAKLSTRLAFENGFWRWTKDGQRVAGDYLLDGGSRLPLQFPLQGRFPHDLLSDRVTCSGITAELWRDVGVVRRVDRLTPLSGAEGFWCQERSSRLGPGRMLDAGLYVAGPAVGYRLEAGPSTVLDPTQQEALAERRSGRVVAETGRLRYGLAAGGAPLADLLTLADQWRGLRWLQGRLALDTPLALAASGGDLLFVTPDGVVPAPAARVVPTSAVAATTSDPAVLAGCGPSVVRLRDGSAHAERSVAHAPLSLRCSDGSALEGTMDGTRDLGAFGPAAPEAVERVMLAELPGDLRAWRQTDAPAIELTFRDEPARLVDGRFDFDAFATVATTFSGTLEMATQSGWWRVAAEAPGLDQTTRPPASFGPATVKELSHDRMTDGTGTVKGPAALCVRLASGAARLWDGDQTQRATQTCRWDRGDAGSWHLWSDPSLAESPAQAEAVALNGAPLTRTLSEGRFDDLRLTGAAQGDPDNLLLVPTELGVLLYGPDGAIGTWRLDPGGFLAATRSGGMAHVSRQGVLLLDEAGRSIAQEELLCPALAPFAAALPEGVSVLRADPAESGMARVLITSAQGRQAALLSCADPGESQIWAEANTVADHPRRLALGAIGPSRLVIRLDGTRLAITSQDRVLSLPLPVAMADIRAMLTGPRADAVYLVTSRDLWEVPLGAAIGAVATSGTTMVPAAPARAPASTHPPDDAEGPAPVAPVPQISAPALDPVVPPPTTATPPVVPASASGPAEEPELEERAVQRALKALVDPRLVVDGQIGPRSRAAITTWQAGIGAEPTGYLGADQAALLLEQVP
jgi:hypothetical protein